MAVNFDRLLHAPAMTVFGEPVIVTPEGGAPVEGRGSYAERAVEDYTGDTPVTSAFRTLSIRDAEFPVTPVQGLQIEVPRVGFTGVVDDIHRDGQGGTMLVLKKV